LEINGIRLTLRVEIRRVSFYSTLDDAEIIFRDGGGAQDEQRVRAI